MSAIRVLWALFIGAFLLLSCRVNNTDATNELNFSFLSDSLAAEGFDSAWVVVIDSSSGVSDTLFQGRFSSEAGIGIHALPEGVGNDYVVSVRAVRSGGNTRSFHRHFEFQGEKVVARIDVPASDPDTVVTRPDPDTVGIDTTDKQPQNQPPTAKSETHVLNEDTPFDFSLSTSDPDRDDLTLEITLAPKHGKLTGSAPNLTYTPDDNYYGPDTLNYRATDDHGMSASATVFFMVTPVNDKPIATAGATVTPKNTPKTITLTGSDVDSEELSYTIVDEPVHGTLSGTPPVVTYTPNKNFSGKDSLGFVVFDGELKSDVVYFRIGVDFTNEAPVADAQDLSMDEDGILEITLTGSDADEDALDYIVVTQPINGSLTGTAPDLVYRPAPNFNGSDMLVFKVNDGLEDSEAAQVTINVASVNDVPTGRDDAYSVDEDQTLTVSPPQGVLANDSDPDGDAITAVLVEDVSHGSLTLNANGSFTYTPTANYNGADAFTYRAVDANNAESAVIAAYITVTPVPDAPVLGAISNKTVAEGSKLTFTVTATDPDGTTPTLSATGLPAGASFTGGVFDWTPDYNQAGSYTVTFKATDAGGLFDSKGVSISVSNTDRAPVFTKKPGNSSLPIHSNYLADISTNDPDGQEVALSIVEGPAGMDIVNGKVQWFADRALPENKPGNAINVSIEAKSGTLSATASWTLQMEAHVWNYRTNNTPLTDIGTVASSSDSLFAYVRVGQYEARIYGSTDGGTTWGMQPRFSSLGPFQLSAYITEKSLVFIGKSDHQSGWEIERHQLSDGLTTHAKRTKINSSIVRPDGAAIVSYMTLLYDEDDTGDTTVYLDVDEVGRANVSLGSMDVTQFNTVFGCGPNGIFKKSPSTSEPKYGWIQVNSTLKTCTEIQTDKNDGSTVYVLDANTNNLYRTKNGQNHQMDFSPVTLKGGIDAKSIFMVSDEIGWIVSEDGSVYFTNDGFQSEPTAETLQVNGSSVAISRLFLSRDGQAVFAIGEGRLFRY